MSRIKKKFSFQIILKPRHTCTLTWDMRAAYTWTLQSKRVWLGLAWVGCEVHLTEVGIYKRKKNTLLTKKAIKKNDNSQEKRKKTRSRPRKRSRKNDNGQEKGRKTRSWPRKRSIKKLYSSIITFLFSFINSHLKDFKAARHKCVVHL